MGIDFNLSFQNHQEDDGNEMKSPSSDNNGHHLPSPHTNNDHDHHNLSSSSPNHLPSSLCLKPQKINQYFKNGIVHCGSDLDDKGGVMMVFLHQWMTNGGRPFRHIWFLDDKIKHLNSIHKTFMQLGVSGTLIQYNYKEDEP